MDEPLGLWDDIRPVRFVRSVRFAGWVSAAQPADGSLEVIGRNL